MLQLGVKALTVEDLLQAQKEISAHNRQLKEQTKQLERDMALLRDHSLLLVRPQGPAAVTQHPRPFHLTSFSAKERSVAFFFKRLQRTLNLDVGPTTLRFTSNHFYGTREA